MIKTETQSIEIPIITLIWSDWYTWHSLMRDARSDPQRVKVPDAPGVYEARFGYSEERLTIGRGSNLRMRVRQGLVKGKVPHSSGRKIRATEDTAQIVIRWATTNRPAAVEEELHLQYRVRFGGYPKYTECT